MINLKNIFFILAALGFWVVSAVGEEREIIRISASNDRVIPIIQREKALEIGERLLDNSPAGLKENLDELQTPFLFRTPEIVEVDESTAEEETDTALPKDDFEVLRILAPRLQREVQGSLILGQRKRLIWAGGQSVEVGYTFSTRISEGDPNLYQITISEIREKSFSIRLNDAEITIPIGDTSSTGAVRGGGA